MDLEKAFDRVPREVIRWVMRKLGVEEWLVSAVMSGAKTVFRTVYGNSSGFEVKVGVHQGSALSPLLLPAALRAAQTCRYFVYSEADFEVFRPAGATRCTDGGEISSMPNFTPIGATVRPPKVKFLLRFDQNVE